MRAPASQILRIRRAEVTAPVVRFHSGLHRLHPQYSLPRSHVLLWAHLELKDRLVNPAVMASSPFILNSANFRCEPALRLSYKLYKRYLGQTLKERTTLHLSQRHRFLARERKRNPRDTVRESDLAPDSPSYLDSLALDVFSQDTEWPRLFTRYIAQSLALVNLR
jgi:hypothetical protein